MRNSNDQKVSGVPISFREGLRGSNVATPRDFADRLAKNKGSRFLRNRFTLSLPEARARVRREFKAYPSHDYLTEIESWRELRDDLVEFTIKRLREKQSEK